MKKLFVYIVLMTALLARMDWQPIHEQWWSNGVWPAWALGSFTRWSPVREWTAKILCPPCGALAENYYFVLMEIEAGTDEQNSVLPVHYSNPLAPDGFRFWWGQGTGREWRPVSMLAWYLYWLPYTVLWWELYARDLFSGRWPWWYTWLRAKIRR